MPRRSGEPSPSASSNRKAGCKARASLGVECGQAAFGPPKVVAPMPKTLSIRGFVVLTALGLGGCSLAREAPPSDAAPEVAAKGGGAAPAAQGPAADATKAGSMPKTSRKVIRNAELAIEVASPAAAESKVSSLV